MRRQASTWSRIGVVACSVGLALTACSIQLPDVELQGQGGGGGGPLVAPTGTLAPGQGQSFGGNTLGGNTLGGGQNAAECVGKATDVGITGKKIRLGSTFAISGPVSNISGPILKGVRAYFNAVNAKGGVNGRQIELKIYDDGWDAQRGKTKIKQLVEQDKVFALTTVPSSNGLDAATSYLEQKKVPVFGTSGLIESQFRSPMQWPIGTSSRSAARISLIDITKRLNGKTIGLVWLDLLAGFEAREGLKEGLKANLAPGARIVADRRVGLSEPSFESVWNDVQNQARKNGVSDGRPDFIGLLIDPTNAVKALQAAQRLGFKPKIAWGGGAPLFLDLVMRDAPYATATHLYAGTSYFPPISEFESMPAVAEYIKTVRRYYGDVDLNNPYLEGGYAGAALTVHILNQAGACLTRAKVIELGNNITNYSAAGLTQPLTYRPDGTSPEHYGNTYGLLVMAVPKGAKYGDGKYTCNRSIGCWTYVRAPTSNGWYQDPTPGK
jgi:branched-chain amino acid transport system substrate-binding protein